MTQDVDVAKITLNNHLVPIRGDYSVHNYDQMSSMTSLSKDSRYTVFTLSPGNV